MPTVLDILATKGDRVHTIPESATVLQATQVMNEQKIGALVVMAGKKVAGIFTERDVLSRVITEERNPREARVRDVMTRDVVCCSPDTDIDDASAIMRDRRIRHLPVCDDEGRLHGLISIGDLNAYHASHQEAHINFLSEYVYGRV